MDAKWLLPLLLVSFILIEDTSVSRNLFFSLDSRIHHHIRGDRQLDDKYLVVYIDEEDIHNMGGWPISRDYYGYMSHALTEMNARLIAFDILFSESTDQTAEFDAELCKFVAAGNRTVLPMLFRSFSLYSSVDPIFPFDSLRQSAKSIGFSNLEGKGALHTELQLKTEYQEKRYHSFGARLAREYSEASTTTNAKINVPHTLFLNHFGGWDNVESISFVELLKQWQNSPNSLDLTNKLVLVCVVYPGVSSPVSTPLIENLPAGLIHLTVAENLIESTYIRNASWYWRLLAVGLIIFLIYVFTFPWKMLYKISAGIAILILYLSSSLWLFKTSNMLLPLIAPFGLFAFLTGLHTYIIHTTSRLEAKHQDQIKSLLHEKSTELKEAESRISSLRSEIQNTASVSEDRMAKVIAGRQEIIQLEKEIRDLQSTHIMASSESISESITKSIVHSPNGQMSRVLDVVQTFGKSDMPILIIGETGTGKELIARELHNVSDRKDEPFIAVNCGALSHELLISELFGHTRGSFTGASKDRKGRFELADKGTLFLDEITETDKSFQASLLRVLQEGTFERIGEEFTRQVDVRIIAASNRDLEAEMNEQRFRTDLFYRLNGMTIELPSLEQRSEDIPLLAEHFITKYSQYSSSTDAAKIALSEESLRKLSDYHWPGNVRELENVTHRAVVLAQSAGRSLIRLEDLPEEIRYTSPKSIPSTEFHSLEEQILNSLRELKFSRSAITKTARKLGNRDRGTITEYLRGIIFRFLAENNFDKKEAMITLAGSEENEVCANAARKINDYVNNLETLISNPTKDSKSAFRGLPKAYHPYLQQLIDHLQKTSIQ